VIDCGNGATGCAKKVKSVCHMVPRLPSIAWLALLLPCWLVALAVICDCGIVNVTPASFGLGAASDLAGDWPSAFCFGFADCFGAGVGDSSEMGAGSRGTSRKKIAVPVNTASKFRRLSFRPNTRKC